MKNAQQAGMLCNEPLFRAFLKQNDNVKRYGVRFPNDQWPFLRDKEAAAIAVRFIIGIDSRRDLDTDYDAAAIWREMVADYELWKVDV